VTYGPLTALDDQLRPGKEPTIRAEAWLVDPAWSQGRGNWAYPHELWTMRLLARPHANVDRRWGMTAWSQGIVCKILNKQELKLRRVRYCLERRDAVVHTWFHRLEDVGCYEPNFGNGGLVAPGPFAEQIL
jgi:hypothetical protein